MQMNAVNCNCVVCPYLPFINNNLRTVETATVYTFHISNFINDITHGVLKTMLVILTNRRTLHLIRASGLARFRSPPLVLLNRAFDQITTRRPSLDTNEVNPGVLEN